MSPVLQGTSHLLTNWVFFSEQAIPYKSMKGFLYFPLKHVVTGLCQQ